MGSILDDDPKLPENWGVTGCDGKEPDHAFRQDGLTVTVFDRNLGAYTVQVPHLVKLERHVVVKATNIYKAVKEAQRRFPDGDGEGSCGICRAIADGSDGRPFLVFKDSHGRPKRLCTKHAVEWVLRHQDKYRPECKEPGCTRQVGWNCKTGYCQYHWRDAKKAGKA